MYVLIIEHMFIYNALSVAMHLLFLTPYVQLQLNKEMMIKHRIILKTSIVSLHGFSLCTSVQKGS
jgi:hypothetical protein